MDEGLLGLVDPRLVAEANEGREGKVPAKVPQQLAAAGPAAFPGGFVFDGLDERLRQSVGVAWRNASLMESTRDMLPVVRPVTA